jgi:hypothetical protein
MVDDETILLVDDIISGIAGWIFDQSLCLFSAFSPGGRKLLVAR